MNRWALRPTDTFNGRRALIGTSMVMDCFCRTDTLALLLSHAPFGSPLLAGRILGSPLL